MMTQKNSNKLLEISNIIKIYTKGEELIKAVNGITLSVTPKSFISIMGPSGSGKSTFLNLLCGIQKPTSGTIILDGQNLSKLSHVQLCDVRRHKVGIIFQSAYMHDGLTAIQNIEHPLLITGIKKTIRRKRAKQLINYVGLKEKSNYLPNQLSGGERQRIGIARALSNDPLIIIADEPTGNLDSHTSLKIIQILQNLVEDSNKSVIMVTHDESLISSKMRLLIMNDGKFIRDNQGRMAKR